MRQIADRAEIRRGAAGIGIVAAHDKMFRAKTATERQGRLQRGGVGVGHQPDGFDIEDPPAGCINPFLDQTDQRFVADDRDNCIGWQGCNNP